MRENRSPTSTRSRETARGAAAPVASLEGERRDLDDYIETNRRGWNNDADAYQREHASQLDEKDPAWGVWARPESELAVLGDVSGKDVLEFGCGAAQWSIALAKRGARIVGLDLSEQQLAHARQRVSSNGLRIPIVQANAEQTPFADASFDVVFCDHGATTFADPRRTVPEAARLLRSGGLLAFNMASPLLETCWDSETDAVSERLINDYFELRQDSDGDRVVFQLPHGEWIRLFRRSGLCVEDLIEIRPGADDATTYTEYVPLEWARRWPAENIWKLRKE